MRVTRYLRLEKNIAASDTGGILERWTFGRRLLMDDTATYPKSGNLKAGVLARYIAQAKAAGFSLTEREIQYRIQCARAYPTEAQLRTACSQFGVWSDLRSAGFPHVDAPDDGEPYDPRDADEKSRDSWNELKRHQAQNPEQLALPYELPAHFSHDTYGPRTPVSTLIAACDESERYTANMAKKDGERRAYVNELVAAIDGKNDTPWWKAEGKRLGLAGIGVSTWDEVDEIWHEFLNRHDDTPDDVEDE